MSEMEPEQCLELLAHECEQTVLRSHWRSRRYYFVSYALMILSLAGSIGAAALAFWDDVDRAFVGIVALLPAVCASAAGQLRLIEKGNWHFRRKHVMQRLARDFRLSRLRGPSWETVELANRALSEVEETLEADWSSALAVRFQSSEAASRLQGVDFQPGPAPAISDSIATSSMCVSPSQV